MVLAEHIHYLVHMEKVEAVAETAVQQVEIREGLEEIMVGALEALVRV